MPIPTGRGFKPFELTKGVVEEQHIKDEAVATAKIPDLAVTFPDKIDNPIWVTAFGTFTASNVSITTTETTQISETVDVPAWVDQVSVFLVGILQLTNTSGSNYDAIFATFADGVGGGGIQQNFPNNENTSMVDATVANLAGVAGSSITVEATSRLSSGTNSSNQHYVYGFAVGLR